jgi:ribonuclease-3
MNTRVTAVHALEQKLGYQFKDRELLERALTHASVGEGATKVANNEVLEFLGDRVLGLLVADALARRFPQATEGELAPRLNGLVSRETCARVALALDIGPALRMSGSATKIGARERGSVLAGACEALIAAVYKDSDLETTRAVFIDLWRDAFSFDGDTPNPRRDSKTALQEWAQGSKRPAPAYTVVSRTGPDHEPKFIVEAKVDGVAPSTGEGRSRQEAEKAAAKAMLQREGVQ